MGRKIELSRALAEDPAPLRAPPNWTNAVVALVNGRTVLHAGGGTLQGRWHTQDSDEFLLVIAGTLVVDLPDGQLSAGAGEAILIEAGEPHRTAVPDGCLLLSVEAADMRRTDVADPGATVRATEGKR